ncbi:MAG: hypothetical protein Kow00129_03340 [Thermoleophilia bacterium]
MPVLNMFVKMWVAIFVVFVVLGVLIVGGDWFERNFGTWPTLALFAALFVIFLTASRVFFKRR